jgi:putative ABC transport system permease protein
MATAVNIALAGVVNGVLLKPLPFPKPEQLVFVNIGPTTDDLLSYPELRDIAQRATVFQSLGMSYRDSEAFQHNGVTVGLQGRQIAGRYFQTFGVQPQLGRLLTGADVGRPLVVIADAIWRKYYHSNAAAIGARMELGGKLYTIAGVAPRNFRDARSYGLIKPSYWIPVDPDTSGCVDRGCHAYVAVGRLRPGVGITSANADMSRVSSAIAAANPTHYANSRLGSVHSMLDTIIGPVRWLLWILYAAATLVLIIACANVANLQLVRGILREGQVAMNLALGASQARIVRQLSVESAVLAAIGGAIGVLLAIALIRAFSFAGMAFLPRWESVSIDWHVALYAIGLLVVIAGVTGTLPAIVFARDAARALRSAGRAETGANRSLFRTGLVCIEIALAFALTVSAGLTLRSFLSLTHTEVGFRPEGVYDAYFGFLPDLRYSSDESRIQFATRAKQTIARIPGVVSASVTNGAPFADTNSTNARLPGGPRSHEQIDLYTVDGGFFKTMQVPVLRGRAIRSSDNERAMPVIVVSEALAKRYFGTPDVVGKAIIPGMCGTHRYCGARTIVGVAGDTRDSFASPPVPTAYVPTAQMPRISHVLIRLSPHAQLAARDVTRALSQIDPLLVPPVITAFPEILRQDSIRSETVSLFFGGFAIVALVLALAGVYSVTAFSVAARTREFGVRKAIGASDGRVMRGVLSATLVQAAIGSVAGIILTAACARLLSGLLYETSALDAGMFAIILALVLGCAVAAALVPAVRATRIAPAQALRYE